MKSRFFPLSILLSIIFSVCQSPVAMSAENDTDDRPGEKNPVTTSRQTLFRDDEVMLFMGRPNDHEMHYLFATPIENDLMSWKGYDEDHHYRVDEFGPLYDSDIRPVASARGRTIHPQHDYVIYAFFRPDGKVAIEQYDPKARVDDGVGRRVRSNTFSGSTHGWRSLDIALGDLDGLSDDDGWYHDEIVMVHTRGGSPPGVQIYVIGHDADLTSLDDVLIPYSTTPAYTAVDIGDLNGDGVLEIVVGIWETSYDYKLAVYNYSEKDGLVSASTYVASTPYQSEFDLTVGDFDGDGKDEVLVANGPSANHIDILKAKDEDLTLTLAHHMGFDTTGTANIRVVSGLFKFDPDDGWDLSRRQPAVCFGLVKNCVSCSIIEIASNMSVSRINEHDWCIDASDWDDTCSSFPCPKYEISRLDIATGSFTGHGTDKKQTSPRMDLAVSTVEVKTDSYANPIQLRPTMRILRNGSQDTWIWEGVKYDFDQDYSHRNWQLATTVSAADGDGDTYRLGSPAHIVMDNILRLDRIIQEPPKHVDYLPTNPDEPDEDKWVWDVINISGYSDFVSTFHLSSTDTLTTQTTSTSGWEIGGGAEADAKSTVTAGNMDIAEVSISAEVDSKMGYDYEEHKSSYNSDYFSKTYTQDISTNTDDALQGLLHTIDVWRYPILGYYEADSDKQYSFQEIVMPGPAISFDGAGRSHPDWYQPVHENHNLLSYYPFHDTSDSNNTWKPADLGSFNVGDDTHKILMNKPHQLTWDGNAYSQVFKWTEEAGYGETKEYNNTLSESAEITIAYKAKAITVIGSDEEQFTGKVDFHNSNSWGGQTVSSASNSKSTGFGISWQTEANPPLSGYNFMFAAYITSTGGAFKAAYAVDEPVNDWWSKQYGRKPDPALNLPLRLLWHQADQAHGNTEYWLLNTEESKHSMRGFFLREPEEDPDTKSYPLISSAIVDGDTVRLCASVYNYSLSDEPTGNFGVQFYYYPWDVERAEKVHDPVAIESDNTTTNVDSLTGADEVLAKSGDEFCVNWETAGLSTMYAVNTFRFQVVLDENKDINEIHELYDENGGEIPGSNNIGTYPWSNAVAVYPSSGQLVPGQTYMDLNQSDLSIEADSMGVKTANGIVRVGVNGKPLQLELGKTYDVRALVWADLAHPFYRLLLLYDGPPDGKDMGRMTGHPAGKGQGNPGGKGNVIGSSRVHGLEAGPTYVWTRWTPDTLGKQEIWMHLLEDADEVNPGNAIDSLDVIVVPAKKERKQPNKTK